MPVARGGKSTAANLRLRCRAHNQFKAEQTFGAGFMQEKRARAARPTAPTSAASATARPRDEAADPDLDVTPWLRQLGFRADEAMRAAAQCAPMDGASIETRVRAALTYLSPRGRRSGVRRAERPVA